MDSRLIKMKTINIQDKFNILMAKLNSVVQKGCNIIFINLREMVRTNLSTVYNLNPCSVKGWMDGCMNGH